jgi:hypothetical protein
MTGSQATVLEFVDFEGWPECARLSNGQIELIATTAVGPRIVRLGFVGGQNLFKVFDADKGATGGDEWRSFGGHRLWHAPEVFPRTYEPDNVPVEHAFDGTSLSLRNSETLNGIDKEILVTLHPDAPKVKVVMRMTNRNPWAIELAVWSLSVMNERGRAIYPQEPYIAHPDCVSPARPLVLWHFTDMSDPRWTWSPKYIQLRQDPTSKTKQKIGMLNKPGWAAYTLDGEAFLKRFPYDPAGTYTDYGCNCETYTQPDMLEVETLGPTTRIEPGETIEHVETWLLAKVDCGESDAEIDSKILPLVAELPAL